jgi:putative flippase GtrA
MKGSSAGGLARFARFTMIGGACFLGNLAVLWICTSLLGIQYLLSALISFVTTNLLGYVGNRLFAFRSIAPHRLGEAGRYYASALLSLVACMAMMKVLVEQFHWHYLAANALAGIILMLSNFALHSAWTFPARFRRGSPESVSGVP